GDEAADIFVLVDYRALHWIRHGHGRRRRRRRLLLALAAAGQRYRDRQRGTPAHRIGDGHEVSFGDLPFTPEFYWRTISARRCQPQPESSPFPGLGDVPIYAVRLLRYAQCRPNMANFREAHTPER